MGKISKPAQQGVALPVMLIILVVMLISSAYLLKSSNSSTMSASNMAYDAALSKAADLGLHKGFQYLQARGMVDRNLLAADDAGNGYYAKYDPTQSVRSEAFWKGAPTVQNVSNGSATPDTIQYVVRRACLLSGPSNSGGNSCLQTAVNPAGGAGPLSPGDSIDVKSTVVFSSPQIHYIITARISGPRGGSVINEMVVLING